MKMSLAAEIASPQSDISLTLVNHMENIKWHKLEIIKELFDKSHHYTLGLSMLLQYTNNKEISIYI